MSQIKIENLRQLLFQAMEKLLDADNPMDVGQAKAVANVGRVLVESAKVEVAYMKLRGTIGSGSGFLADDAKQIESGASTTASGLAS